MFYTLWQFILSTIWGVIVIAASVTCIYLFVKAIEWVEGNDKAKITMGVVFAVMVSAMVGHCARGGCTPTPSAEAER